jgi:hypothetical protein
LYPFQVIFLNKIIKKKLCYLFSKVSFTTMEEEKINEEFINRVKYFKEHGMPYSNNRIEIPSNTNYQTFFEAVRCRLPLRLVPEKMIDFNMAKCAINTNPNSVCSVPHNILKPELFNLALSQENLPHLVLLQEMIPSEYLTNEVYEKYLRRDLKENLKFVPETNLKELQNVIDEINVGAKYENTINNKSEKEKLFQRFDKIEEKEKNILLRLYPQLQEEYQQFIYWQNFVEVRYIIGLYPGGVYSLEQLQSFINTCECSEEQRKELWFILDEQIKKFQR